MTSLSLLLYSIYLSILIDYFVAVSVIYWKCSCTIDWTMAEERQEKILAEDAEDALRINPFLVHKVYSVFHKQSDTSNLKAYHSTYTSLHIIMLISSTNILPFDIL